MKIQFRHGLFALALLALSTLNAQLSTAFAQGTAFTYQGRLNSGGAAANGSYDIAFTLFATNTSGVAIAGPVTNSAVSATNGLFTTTVDFGNVFTGGSNWLQIAVSTNGANSFFTLAPRLQLTPVPYAITAENVSGAVAPTALSGTYGKAVTLTNAGNSFTGNGAGLTNVNATTLGGLAVTNFWQLTGNAGTSPSVNYLGTPDNEALNFRVNNTRGLSIQPDPLYGIPNIIGGSFANFIAPPGVGNVIAGGGYTSDGTNFITGGGNLNVISGGYANHITNGYDAVIGGGDYNTVGANSATVPGGYLNIANGQYSFAAGQQAQALHSGSFVWSDNSGGAYSSQGANEFLIRAAGGVGIDTVGAPQQDLSVQGGVNIDQDNGNAGFLNNGLATGYGLSFGNNSGEGIASKRTAGGNQNGLDFYTGYSNKMSILNSGFVGIGTQTPVNAADTLFQIASATTNSYVGMWIETGTGGLPFYGYSEGGSYSAYTYVDGTDANKWKLLNGGGIWLTVTTGGDVGIGTTTPGSALEVANGDVRLDGNRLLLYSGSDTNNGIGAGIPGGLPGIFSGAGPFIFGYDGGALGAVAPNTVCLSWDYLGDVWVSNNLSTATLTIRDGMSVGDGMNVDQANLNGGTVSSNALTFGLSSGEGIGSQRVGGSTANGLDGLEFYTDFARRMTILQNGNVGIGSTNPANLLVVGGSASPAYCNGTTWVNGSDRNSKQNFASISPREVLEKVSALPITEWQYKVEADGIKHLGPMAQDFHAAFGLNGADDKHITTVDEGGVALAAIQGLNQKLEQKDTEITELKARLEKLEQLINSMNGGTK